jgi:hypothetical protein
VTLEARGLSPAQANVTRHVLESLDFLGWCSRPTMDIGFQMAEPTF